VKTYTACRIVRDTFDTNFSLRVAEAEDIVFAHLADLDVELVHGGAYLGLSTNNG
jgi:hypothetical protein